ncbi:PQQ-binding-like beta-propeller repeat protein [Spirillospora sp. CA-253888]
MAAPAPAWSLSWPAGLADGLPLAVAVAGGTVVWRGGSGLVGVDAALGRRLWTFERPVGSTFNEGYRVHGGTVYAVAARPAKTVHVIDPRTGAARSVDVPGDMTSLTDTYGTSGTTLFVGASTGGETTVLAVDLADGRVRWRFPTGARSVRGTADAGAVYLCTATQIIAIDAATGRRRWTHDWSADQSRSTGYPLTLGDGLLFFGATGDSLVRAVRAGDGSVAWSKPARDVQRPVVASGPTLATVGTKGFHVYDQATGAVRRQQLSSPADLDFLGGTKTISGSDRLLAAAFADTERDAGFFAAPTGGGSPWAHRGEAQDRGWRLAVSGPAVYATDNRRLHCFRTGA